MPWAVAAIGAYGAYVSAAQSNPYLRRAMRHTMAMQNGEPTWSYCEICDRETPHMRYLGRDHCVYTSVVHPREERSISPSGASEARIGRDRSRATSADGVTCHAEPRDPQREAVCR